MTSHEFTKDTRDIFRLYSKIMANIGTIHERIKVLVDTLAGGKNTVFAQKLGVSEANIRGYIKNVVPKADVLEKIVTSYDVNAEWLLSGNGELHKSTENIVIRPSNDGTGIPLIPVEAMAGYFTGEQTVLLQECDRYVVPAFKNADFLIHVRGDSMMPHYFSGDMVACKMLSLSDIFFQWGKVYVINTDQGALIKKVEQGTTDESITLVSENDKYKPFEISRRGIYQIAIVIGLIRAE